MIVQEPKPSLIRTLLPYLITAITLAVILYTVDLEETALLLRSSRLMPIVLLFFLGLLNNLFTIPLKLRLVFRSVGCGTSMRDAVMLRLGGRTVRFILPFRLGEGVKILFLMRAEKMEMAPSLGVVAFDKCSSLMSFFIFVWVAIVVSTGIASMPSLFLLLFLCALGAFTFSRIGASAFLILSKKLWRGFYKVYELLEVMQKIDFKSKLAAVGLSAASWFIEFAQFYLSFKAVSALVPLRSLFTDVPVVMFFSALPIAVEGLGIREVSVLSLMAEQASRAELLSASLLVSFFETVLFVIIGLLFIKPLVRRIL